MTEEPIKVKPKPKWEGKEIKDLTNDELSAASWKLLEMQTFRNAQLAKRKERHEKFDLDNTNPAFDELKAIIGKEITDRGI